mgnify:CR=1 FL=1
MTRMERRRRRRRILRIKLATTAAVLALTTASIVALTGGAAETAPEPTPQPPVLQAEPVLLVAEHDSTYQPVQMTAEPVQEPEPVEEEDENEKIEAALLEQGYLHEEIPLDFDLQCHLITVCEEYGVPQSVALGVIQAESSFTATASNGSCYGYMQINSINSEWLSEKIGVTDLTDPYQNSLPEEGRIAARAERPVPSGVLLRLPDVALYAGKCCGCVEQRLLLWSRHQPKAGGDAAKTENGRRVRRHYSEDLGGVISTI